MHNELSPGQVVSQRGGIAVTSRTKQTLDINPRVYSFCFDRAKFCNFRNGLNIYTLS